MRLEKNQIALVLVVTCVEKMVVADLEQIGGAGVTGDMPAEFAQRIAEHDEVMECYLMTGDSDYLIRVAIADMSALEKFILEQLTPIPGVEKIRSSFALKQVRYKTALPLKF